MLMVRPVRSGWWGADSQEQGGSHRAFIPLHSWSLAAAWCLLAIDGPWQREDFTGRSRSRCARLYVHYCRSAAYRID